MGMIISTIDSVIPFSNTKSVLFDGATDYITLGTGLNAMFEYNIPWSISVWVKKAAAAGEYTIVGSKDGAPNFRGISFELFLNRIYFQLLSAAGGGNYIEILGNTTLINNAWNHLCITYNGNSNQTGLTLYVNNVVDTKTVFVNALSGTTVSTGPLYIGHNPSGAEYFPGKIDEMAFFDSELTAGQVSAIYNGGVANSLATNPDITTWYRLGDTPDDATTVGGFGDRIGVNNGTGVSMTAANIVSDAP